MEDNGFRFGFTSLLFCTLGAAAECLALCGELLEGRHELGEGSVEATARSRLREKAYNIWLHLWVLSGTDESRFQEGIQGYTSLGEVLPEAAGYSLVISAGLRPALEPLGARLDNPAKLIPLR